MLAEDFTGRKAAIRIALQMTRISAIKTLVSVDFSFQLAYLRPNRDRAIVPPGP
ncbi:hypothetical protein ACVWYQ_003186 [Bradyrhizobium sp. USDA 3397]